MRDKKCNNGEKIKDGIVSKSNIVECECDEYFEHYSIELEKMNNNHMTHKRQPSIHTMFKTEYMSMYADTVFFDMSLDIANEYMGEGDYKLYEEWLSNGKYKKRRNIFR